MWQAVPGARENVDELFQGLLPAHVNFSLVVRERVAQQVGWRDLVAFCFDDVDELAPGGLQPFGSGERGVSIFQFFQQWMALSGILGNRCRLGCPAPS